MDADGTDPVNLTNNAAQDNGGTWSPDGTKIAFSSDRIGAQTDIYVMNSTNGSNQTRLTESSAADDAPFWKPSSSEIVFFSDRAAGDSEVYRMKVDGTNEVRLTFATGVDISGPWRPIDYPGSDFDKDGCSDQQESGSNPVAGGLRSAQNFWDFYDTPTGMSFIRDKAVAGTDFFAVLGRFGSTGSTLTDPLSTPPAAPAYHPAFDRSAGPASPAQPFLSGPADGSIAGTDFFRILAQFGHTCA
jgi:hypothetical protein